MHTGFSSRLLKWTSDAGVVQEHGVELQPDTYYAELPIGRACAFGFTLSYDAALIATGTVDGTDLPSSAAVDYEADGWDDESAITDVTINATEGVTGRHVVEFERARARVKLVVATAGACALYVTVKGN